MKIHLKEIASYLKKYLHLCRVLLKDPETPLISKILLGVAVGYAFMPFDLIPDFIPVIGHIDDVLIIPGLIYLALKFIPTEIIKKHKEQIQRDYSIPVDTNTR